MFCSLGNYRSGDAQRVKKSEIEKAQQIVEKRYYIMLIVLVGEMLSFYYFYDANQLLSSPKALLWWVIGVVTMAALALFVYDPIVKIAYKQDCKDS